MNCKVLFLPFFMLFLSSTTAQNLVPNGGFEEYSFCPNTTDQLHGNCLGWFKSIQMPGLPMNQNPSPDYFHGCAGSNPFLFGTPTNIMGNQEAHTGQAYAGLITYSLASTDYREIIGVELEESLIVGEEYLVRLFICRGGEYRDRRASNNIGFKFTTYSPFHSNNQAINNFAHFKVDSVVTDSDNWLELNFSFLADSAYNYLNIGNFLNDLYTVQIPMATQQSVSAYYLIDDVSVERTSRTLNNLNRKLSLFPSPCMDQLNLQLESSWLSKIEIYSPAGTLVREMKTKHALNYKIDTKSIEKGLYILRLYDKNGASFSKPFLKL